MANSFVWMGVSVFLVLCACLLVCSGARLVVWLCWLVFAVGWVLA